jgi:hypothetical protein
MVDEADLFLPREGEAAGAFPSGSELRLWTAMSLRCSTDQKKSMTRCARTGEVDCDQREGKRYLVAVGIVRWGRW